MGAECETVTESDRAISSKQTDQAREVLAQSVVVVALIISTDQHTQTHTHTPHHSGRLDVLLSTEQTSEMPRRVRFTHLTVDGKQWLLLLVTSARGAAAAAFSLSVLLLSALCVHGADYRTRSVG